MGSPDDDKATLWLSLRFLDGGTENGFIQAHAEKLAFNMACLSLTGVVLACTALGFNCNIHGSCPTSSAAQVEKETMYILIGAAVQYFVVACCFKTNCIIGRIGFVEREVICVVLLVEALAVNAFIDPYYLARVQGYDCQALWPDRHFSDSPSLLFIDGIITAAHMMLPLRWFLLVPVQVVGVLRYTLLGLLFSPEDFAFVNLVFLAALVYVASVGKRTLEQHERRLFSSFLTEKSLRFQSEFELSQMARATGALPPEAASGGAESIVPSTTDSGHAFNNAVSMGVGDLEQIAAIGEKEQWLVAATELQVTPKSVLGSGSFGVVFYGRYQGTPVAVKMRKAKSGVNSPAQLLQLCNELRILRRLRHPNIVFLYGACLDTIHGDLALVLELVDGVQLRHFVWSGSSPNRDERASCPDEKGPSDTARFQVILDMSCALRYLHTRTPRIVHGDLKDTNVLIEPARDKCSHRAKLLDFGLARVCTRHAKVLGGTLLWVAPELVRNRVRPNSSADVFSFGRLVFFVLTGRFPIENASRSKLRQYLRNAELPELQWGQSSRAAAVYRPLVEECTQVDPGVRPSMSQVHARLDALHGRGADARSDDGDAPGTDLADSTAMLRHVRGIISTPTHRMAAAAASSSSVPMPPSAATDFNEDSSSNRSSKHLSSVPENEVKQGGTGSTNIPEATLQPLALPAFQRTPNNTQLLMLIDVIMHCNVEMPVGACCFFHAGVQKLKDVCEELERRACLNMRDRAVSGQCKECGALGRDDPTTSYSASYTDAMRECFFCGGGVDLCTNDSTNDSPDNSSRSI